MTNPTPKSEFSAEDRKLLLLFVDYYADAKQLLALGLVFDPTHRRCCFVRGGNGDSYGLTDTNRLWSSERYCDHNNITGPLREAILAAHSVFLLQRSL